MSDEPDPPTDEEMEQVIAALLQVDPEGISGKATKKATAKKPKGKSDG